MKAGWGRSTRASDTCRAAVFRPGCFEAECLREYAETFPTVCGDFAFYQFPTEEFWRKLFARDALAVSDSPSKCRNRSPAKCFPPTRVTARKAARRTRGSSTAGALHGDVSAPAAAVPRARPAVLIFEFGIAFGRAGLRQLSPATRGEFLGRLDPFLAALPPEFRYAVEIRNPEFLAADYFSCLRSPRVAHVYNAWSEMPELRRQMAIPGFRDRRISWCAAPCCGGAGMYEDAVAAFAPYTEVRDPNPEARESMRVLIGRAREDKRMLFLFVNNRLEGNAPLTILSLVE